MCRASAPLMQLHLYFLPYTLKSILPLERAAPTCSPALPGERALRVWLLFLLLPSLMGAMWVPQLAPMSQKASCGSHSSSFIIWRRRQSVHAAETRVPPLLLHHPSWRSAASDYYLVPPTLKSDLKGNTSNRTITAPQNPHA